MKTKALLLAMLCSFLTTSCSEKKIGQLSEQISTLKTQIAESKDSIYNQNTEIVVLSKIIKETERELDRCVKDTTKLNADIYNLIDKIEQKRVAAEKARNQPVKRGRQANEVGPNDKRFTVDSKSGVIIY